MYMELEIHSVSFRTLIDNFHAPGFQHVYIYILFIFNYSLLKVGVVFLCRLSKIFVFESESTIVITKTFTYMPTAPKVVFMLAEN